MFARKLDPGLELRPLQPSDAPALFAVVDAHRAALREWLPWVDATNTVADSAAYIAGTMRDDRETRAFSSGIWSMGRLVGVIGHNRIDWASRIGFPAYWIAPDSAGQGIMTQCCRAVIEHAFGELQLRQLVVAVATENLRAQKIPLRLGFKKVSTLKKAEWLYDHHVDHIIYSLAAAKARTPPSGHPSS
jgi:ribosomal-protein-serine acetyltransferase